MLIETQPKLFHVGFSPTISSPAHRITDIFNSTLLDTKTLYSSNILLSWSITFFSGGPNRHKAPTSRSNQPWLCVAAHKAAGGGRISWPRQTTCAWSSSACQRWVRMDNYRTKALNLKSKTNHGSARHHKLNWGRSPGSVFSYIHELFRKSISFPLATALQLVGGMQSTKSGSTYVGT